MGRRFRLDTRLFQAGALSTQTLANQPAGQSIDGPGRRLGAVRPWSSQGQTTHFRVPPRNTNFSNVLATSVKVYMQPLYVTQIKLEDAARLATVVRGLRNMDACLAPWIAAQYCWLDFDKRWEMANSAARQSRCAQRYASNGAAYLETVLRNVQWPKLQSCWGTSLDIALAAPLRASAGDVGTAWWASLSVAAASTSVEDEVSKWQSHNISSFVTDWQNYKSIGIIDTYQVQNAFGFSYPMTLKHTNGTMQLSSQTSMKMYWAFASDLWAATAESTLMYGKSLIRQTGDRFAFQNVSMEDVLLQNGTLQRVDQGAFATFRRTIGPFGSVDLKHVAVPKSLVQFVLHVKDALTLARTSSSALSYAYNALEEGFGITAVPVLWYDTDLVFGAGCNIMCPEGTVWVLSGGLWILTGAGVACNSGVGEFLTPTAFSRLAGVIALGLVSPSTDTIAYADALCDNLGRMSLSTCQSLVNNPVRFLRNTTFFPDAAPQFAAWATEAATAQQDVRNAAVEVFQYGMDEYISTDVTFLRHTLFDPSLPSFDMVSWMLVVEWCLAQREVISVQGDITTINLITSSSADVTSLVNPLELPVNVASYIRYACLYVTCAIICVALLATLYLLANRGYVEGVNMFELNRVAGIVWVGRTLLFVRGLAAISLLSTQVLTLTPVQLHWGFSAPTVLPDETTTDKALRFFKTFLAAGEVSWLGFVLSDMLIVVTQQYTTAYVFKCNFMVWGASAILSLAVLTTLTATMTRELVVSIAVTAIVVVVGIVMVVCAVQCRERIVGHNLCPFNRIVVAVSHGGPFLMVRGMTAVIFLSSAPLQFVSTHGYASLVLQPRSVMDLMVVTVEAMWITDVFLNDVLLLAAKNARPLLTPSAPPSRGLFKSLWTSRRRQPSRAKVTPSRLALPTERSCWSAFQSGASHCRVSALTCGGQYTDTCHRCPEAATCFYPSPSRRSWPQDRAAATTVGSTSFAKWGQLSFY